MAIRRYAPATALLYLGAIFFIGFGGSILRPAPGASTTAPGIAIAAFVVFIGSLSSLYLLRRWEHGAVDTSGRRYLAAFTTLGIILLFALVAGLSLFVPRDTEQPLGPPPPLQSLRDSAQSELQPPEYQPSRPLTPEQSVQSAGGTGPDWGRLWPWFAALASLLLVVVVWRREPGPTPGRLGESETPPPEDPLPDGGPAPPRETALAELSREPDPRRAIIRSYQVLRQFIAGGGVRLPSSLTPTEYCNEVLSLTGLPQRPVRSLTALYQQAHFGWRSMTEEDRMTGIKTLAETLDALDRAKGKKQVKPGDRRENSQDGRGV